MTGVHGRAALISAHRCGAAGVATRENSWPALHEALESDAEYVEFDIQCCADGIFVLAHHDYVVLDGRRVLIASLKYELIESRVGAVRYDDVLQALKGRKKAHLDFKFRSSREAYETPELTHEVRATQMAIDALGVENVIVTTVEDRSVRAVRQWSRTHYPSLLVGLSLGGGFSQFGLVEKIKHRPGDLFPARRVRNCDANLIVVNERLARLNVAAWAAKVGLPTLVWTVDNPRGLEYWLEPGRAWMVTTNFPQRALDIRDAGELVPA